MLLLQNLENFGEILGILNAFSGNFLSTFVGTLHPCRTHPAWVGVVALAVTGLVKIYSECTGLPRVGTVAAACLLIPSVGELVRRKLRNARLTKSSLKPDPYEIRAPLEL